MPNPEFAITCRLEDDRIGKIAQVSKTWSIALLNSNID
jgi:hypothetical protein